MVECLKLRDDAVSVTLRILKNLKNPFFFFKARITKKDKYKYEFRNGISLYLRPVSEPGIYDEVVIRKLYVPDELKEKLYFDDKNATILDIGANVGIFSVFAAKQYPRATIFAFEPVPDNYTRLVSNVNLNKCSNVKPINKGLYDGKNHRIVLNEDPGKNKIADISSSNGNKITIKTDDLNDFIKNKKIKSIDLVKIDCEGSEHYIFNHLSKENLKKIKRITAEIDDLDEKNNINSFVAYLKKNGFTIFKYGPRVYAWKQ